MKKVAVFGQTYTVGAVEEIQDLLDALEQQKVVIFLEKNFYLALNKHNQSEKKYPIFSKFEDLNSSFDMFFSIGGDGTMLRAVTYVRDLNIPILGINTGRLGFLANVKKEEISEAKEHLGFDSSTTITLPVFLTD